MKKYYFLLVFFFNYGFVTLFAQEFGTFASAVWMEDCSQTGGFFNVTGTGVNKVNPNSPEGDFMVNHGNFFQNSGKLVFNGGEVKTFKESNSNVCGVIMFYRYYITTSTPPAFSSLELPFYSNCDTTTGEFEFGGGPCSETDQKWQSVIADYVDLTANPVGDYKLEVYYTVIGAHNSTTDCSDTVRLDNSGTYYTAQFSIIPNPTFNFTDTTSCGGSDGTISISNLIPNTDFSISYNLDGTLVEPVVFTSNASGIIDLTNLTSGTYTNIKLENGNSCSVSYSLSISDPEFTMLSSGTECNTDSSYNIIVKIKGDNPITASGIGSPGVWIDNGDGTHSWTSDDIASGDYNLTFANTKNCSLTTEGNDPNCCSFEVSCPTFPSTSIQCYSLIPSKDTYTEAEFEALGNGDGIIGDNPCGLIIITASNSVDNGTCPQTVTITYTITEYQDSNNNGIRDTGEDVVLNTNDCVQTITVRDEVSPTPPTAPADATYTCLSEVPSADSLTATDNCSPDITTAGVDTYNEETGCELIITRTWTFTDACNNSAAISQTITVRDEVSPTPPTAPADATYTCLSEVPSADSLTATDNCSPDITTAGVDTYNKETGCELIITRTWTFTDACNNSAAVSQTITVIDEVSPTPPTAPADATYTCLSEVPSADSLTATDNCSPDITTAGVDTYNEETGCELIITRTWTFTDACNNSAAINQTITVKDDVAPTFNNVSDLKLACYNETTIQNWLASVIATDNCGGSMNVLNNYVIPSDTCSNDTLVVQFTAIDNCNNTASFSKNIIFSYDSNITYPENTSSVIYDLTLATDPGAPNKVTDNCGNEVTPVLVGSSSNPNPLLCDGFVVWTYRYTLCDSTTHDWTHTYQVITTPAAPTGSSTQTFCASHKATVADLKATPTVANAIIKWYDQAGYLLTDSTLLQNGLHYYATQTLSTSPYCESILKLDVTVVLEEVPMISGNANQEYCVGSLSTVADLSIVVAQGVTAIWYDAPTGGNIISSTSLLTNTTYYAQSVNSNGCKSLTRFAVQVTLDPDCDDDGVLDVQEVVGDTDGDGILDYLDTDDDGDELPTSDEDSNNNGNWFDDDCNANDIVDYLDPISCDLIPNVFSPGNDDDKNDTWVIPYLIQFPNFILEVFDRWGNLVYKYERNGDDDDSIKWWDGKSNGRLIYQKGEILPYGTYFYIINPNDGITKPKTSWVYLNN